MACSLSHTDYEVEDLVQKLIDEDKGRQNAILDLALQFKNSCKAKDDIRNAYEKCTDISQERRTLIDTFLKEVEESLRETLEEQAMDEKKREETIGQKQADDDEFFLKFREYNLDIDDSDLHLTHVLRSSSSACVEPSSSTPSPVRIIPDPAGTQSKQLKENIFILDSDGALMSTQEYMQKVVEDVNEDDDFNSGAWISATNYVISTGGTLTGCLGDINNFLKKRKLDQVVAIVKSCSPNYFGDLNVTMKDLSCTVRGTVHYKVLDVGSYGNDITVGTPMILANTSLDVFLGYNEKESVCDYKVKGSWFDRSCTIYAGESTHIVAQMHKKHTVQSIALGKDTFAVTVYPNVDYAFIVALVVILHEINKQKNDVE
uniref:Protein LURP-one-related 15-like n=1 Tax=Tanacetum cinerariifolium TaxID=118510 RepID=A0A6L2P4Y6_TANCI|nr:hypothetical protein [Tanacetum cinerariifolium]